MPDIKREKRIPNTVHDDAIWRQTISYELGTAKNWKQNWGFMTDAYLEEDAGKNRPLKLPPLPPQPFSSGLPSKLPAGLADSEESILSDWLYAHKVSRIIAHKFPHEKYNLPCTTSSEIGWPWKRVQTKLDQQLPPIPIKQSKTGPQQDGRIGFYTLERYGGYARGRGDVMKWFGGCRESLP